MTLAREVLNTGWARDRHSLTGKGRRHMRQAMRPPLAVPLIAAALLVTGGRE